MKKSNKTDFLAELGSLAIASRLRRLHQRLQADGERIYQSLDVDIKTKWFPVLYLLLNQSALSLTEISRLLCVAHPSIIQTIDELMTAGLVDSRKSDHDGRLRELSLTDRGQQLCLDLRPVWDAFRKAGDAVIKEGGNDFLDAVDKLERSIDRLSMYDRIMAQLEVSTEKKTR